MDGVPEFSAAQQYLNAAGVVGGALHTILEVSHGRAVLVAEVIEQVGAGRLATVLGTDPSSLASVVVAIRSELSATPQMSDRRRYLPPIVSLAHAVAADSFHERVKRSRPEGWSWAELAACGAPLSGACLAAVARDIFEESQQIQSLNAGHPWQVQRPTRLSFIERCTVSGCPLLAPRLEADEARKSLPPQFNEPPAKRLRRASDAGRAGQDPRCTGWAFRGRLEAELQLRMSMRSFSNSWRTYCSGWYAWHQFMESYHLFSCHFPIDLPRVAAFAAHFRNEASLSTYLAWIRTGQSVLCIDDGFSKRALEGLLRGLKASWAPLPKAIMRLTVVEKLVVAAIRSNLIDYARAFAICYLFTLRAQSEAFDLTLDGACSGHSLWHSRIIFGRGSATIILESRKNVRGESRVKRLCCCSHSRAACGPCALHGAMRDAIAQYGDRHTAGRAKLLDLGSKSRARSVLCGLATSVGLDKVSWHGFRRGSATDLVASGSSLTQVLFAGAWRSAAFLRYISTEAIGKRQALDLSFNESDSEHEA